MLSYFTSYGYQIIVLLPELWLKGIHTTERERKKERKNMAITIVNHFHYLSPILVLLNDAYVRFIAEKIRHTEELFWQWTIL